MFNRPMCGGLGVENPADENVQKIVNDVIKNFKYFL